MIIQTLHEEKQMRKITSKTINFAGIANGQDAQDAGVSFFEHILVCTNSMAEATVPVTNCVVVCSLSANFPPP